MNDNQYVEVEELAERVVVLAERWLQDPQSGSTSMDDDPCLQELEVLRDEVKERKYAMMRELGPDERWQLTRRHPVWINEYDLNIINIIHAMPEEEGSGDHCGLVCELSMSEAHSLQIFFWCGGLILKINTAQFHLQRRVHSDDPAIWDVLHSREMLELGIPVAGEFAKVDHMSDDQYTWLFMGNRWECLLSSLSLDFGCHAGEREDFISLIRARPRLLRLRRE